MLSKTFFWYFKQRSNSSIWKWLNALKWIILTWLSLKKYIRLRKVIVKMPKSHIWLININSVCQLIFNAALICVVTISVSSCVLVLSCLKDSFLCSHPTPLTLNNIFRSSSTQNPELKVEGCDKDISFSTECSEASLCTLLNSVSLLINIYCNKKLF